MGLHDCSIGELTGILRSIPLFSGLSSPDMLRSVDFFAGAPDAILEEIAASIVISEFSAGSIVCRHGKFDERFHIILSGEVRAVIPTESNPRFELCRLGQGDFFGEEIIFSASPRENTIIAESDIRTLSLGPEALRRLITSSARIRTLMDRLYIDRDLRSDLRKIPLFTGLSRELFTELLSAVEVVAAAKGSIVFGEGDRGDAFYLIREGRVEVSRTVKGEKKLIAILAEGQYFGEMSLLSDAARNATVECVRDTDLVRISRASFLRIVRKDERMLAELEKTFQVRRKNREDILRNPYLAMVNRKLLDLNKEIYIHLDVLSQCIIDIGQGGALLATLPGSRYPYVYPRDSACASRFLLKVIKSPLRSGETAFRILGEIARFILKCQRGDGYWGQRYGVRGEDKAIYIQEDNVAHGVSILCRYLLAAKHRSVPIPQFEGILAAIVKGFDYSHSHYYRNEIHLFYSTTSIHESAIEEGYSIWVNYAYLAMLRLMESVGSAYGVLDRFAEAMALKGSFEGTLDRIFTMSGRFVRRLRPNGEIDLRPDITLMSPFFFGTGLESDCFINNEAFSNSIRFIEQTLTDPDLGMLQRYLPFIEDPETHVHAGNGPWLQYTSMLAQYHYYTGEIGRGDQILRLMDRYRSKEGYLCEHLTTPERFFEFKRLEWLSGQDFSKEFAPEIMIPGITYDLIVEELNHMKNAYDQIERNSGNGTEARHITFATPLMWSHAEYAMALMFRTEKELERLKSTAAENWPS
jgi:CRP-like cAMP-binding protein